MGPNPNNLLFYHLCASDFSYLVIFLSHYRIYKWLMQNIGEGNGTPLQYSCLENPMEGGAWKAAVHGVAEDRTWLSDFTFTFHFHTLEKEVATHSSVLAWRIPGMAEPGGLLSMGLHRVGHDWSDLVVMQNIKKIQHRTNISHICLKISSVLCNDMYGERIWKKTGYMFLYNWCTVLYGWH